ncbi:MAG: hypothetical protein K2Y23_17675 [Cyanobacteria bacterium]|nr:hypothetical protein [Cyanobacteriota bacterium]
MTSFVNPHHRRHDQHGGDHLEDPERELGAFRVVREMFDAVPEDDDRRQCVLQFLHEKAALGAAIANRDGDHRNGCAGVQ